MKQKISTALAAALFLLASAALAQPIAQKPSPVADGTQILRIDNSDGEVFFLPYDGGIHPLGRNFPGEPLTVTSFEENAAPLTVFTPEAGDGFFFEDGLTVSPGFSGVIDFDFASQYFIYMPLIPGAFAVVHAAPGANAAAAAPGKLKKNVSTDLYSGNGKNVKKSITVAADSNCPVKLKSTNAEVTVQPGFPGEVEEVNRRCKKIKVSAACTGSEGADCSFSVP